jgi:hypothetical protein
MDLEITIDANSHCLTTRTYQKPMNPFLYIPPMPVHPPGVLKSIIYGNLQCSWKQNTYHNDYVHIASQFAQHLIARGHSPDNIHQLFLEVAKTLSRQPTCSNVADTHNTLFFHWEYHPNGIS